MCRSQNYSSKSVSCMPAVCARRFMYPVSRGVDEGACGSTPAVKHLSVPGHYWECDVVTEPVCQICPIGVLWGNAQGCMVANQAE